MHLVNRWADSSRTGLAVLAAVIALLVVACGSGAQASPGSSTAPMPTASTHVLASAMPTAIPTAAATAVPVSSASAPTVVELPSGLLATAQNGVAFLQWTQTGTSVIGSLTQVTFEASGASPQHQVIDFSGVISGDSVTLTLAGGETINGTALLTGQFSNGQFTLAEPEADGTIGTLVFAPATVGDYNNAVASLEADRAAIAERQLDAQASCSVEVGSHNAFVEAKGQAAIMECRHIAATVSFSDGSTWADATAPAVTLAGGVGVICGGLLNGYRVIVFDTAPAYYGGIICHALPLVQATLGIRGSYQPGAAGIQIADLPDPNNSGSMLPGIVPGGPAAKAGLQDGDIISAIDGTTIYGSPLFAGADLTTILAYDSPGQVVRVTYVRAGARAVAAVTLAAAPAGQ